MEEKRRFPRYQYPFEVAYSTLQHPSIENHTVATDASEGGMRMPVSRIVKNGDHLRLTINPNDNKNPIAAIARVVWTKNISRHVTAEEDLGNGKVVWVKEIPRPALLDQEVGIEFTDISRRELPRLLRQLA